MNYCIDCVSYFLDKKKNRYFCADNYERMYEVSCPYFEKKCDDVDSPWHKGVPTEDGLYVIAFKTFGEESIRYATAEVIDNKIFYLQRNKVEREIVAYQKIERYNKCND